MTADTLVEARWVIPVIPRNTVLENHTVVFSGGRIADILPTEAARVRYAGLEAKTMRLPAGVVMPGLINLHTHAAMNLLRGRGADLPLMDWLTKEIWPAEGRLEGYLFKDAVKNQVYVTKKPQPGAKTAVTEYRTLQSRRGLSLVECRLLTGRTHQIRAQMAAAGCPLLGDGKYGRERINRTYGETGQMLYSYKLTFTLPTDAGILEYLRGRTFQVPQVAFAEKYFPGFTLPDVESEPKTET